MLEQQLYKITEKLYEFDYYCIGCSIVYHIRGVLFWDKYFCNEDDCRLELLKHRSESYSE